VQSPRLCKQPLKGSKRWPGSTQPIAREQLSPITSPDEAITEMKDKTFSLAYEKLMLWTSAPLQQQRQQTGTARSLFYLPVFLPDDMGYA